MQLSDLNDDVLRHVCAYLSGTDALSFALAGKRFHELAVVRVGVDFRTDDHYELVLFHKGMCDVDPPRTQYIESMVIRSEAFEDYDGEIKVGSDEDGSGGEDDSDGEGGSGDEDCSSLDGHTEVRKNKSDSESEESDNGAEDEEDAAQASESDSEGDEDSPEEPEDGSNSEAAGKNVALLVDLLTGACNLRRLLLESVHALMTCNSQLAPALVALPRISRLELTGVSDTVVALVGQTGWDLHILSLDYPLLDEDPLPEEQIRTVPVLMDTLAKFPNLHTLEIKNFLLEDWRAMQQVLSSTHRVFPSIRRLFLNESQVSFALGLADRCPNASLIDVGTFHMEDPEELPSRPFSSWPPLRSLRAPLSTLHKACCSARVLELNPVDHFCIPHAVDVADPDDADKAEIQQLLCLLKKTSPVYARLSLAVGCKPVAFWGQVAERAPRLRFLELEISIRELREDYMDWVDNIPEALHPLPLVYLRLHIAELPTSYDCASDSSDELEDPTLPLAREQYHARFVAVPTLAARCARAIPTLQYFVLSDDGPGYAHVTWDKEERYKSGAPCPSSEEEREREERRRADFEEDEDELDECCFYRDPSSMGYAETLQTWRVVREDTDSGAGAGCRLEPLTHAAGKDLHRALVSTFDGQNPPLTENVTLFR